MKNLDIALRYMDIFFSGEDPDELHKILADNLVFEGPLHRFDSAQEYVQSLKMDPPVGCDYSLIRVFESTGSINLIYTFIRGKIKTPMSQLFEFEDGKIVRILLIFDTAELA
jgi:hypothetical protein